MLDACDGQRAPAGRMALALIAIEPAEVGIGVKGDGESLGECDSVGEPDVEGRAPSTEYMRGIAGEEERVRNGSARPGDCWL